MQDKRHLPRALLPVLLLAAIAGAQFVVPAPWPGPDNPAPPVQCRALDALGNPIPKALIQVWRQPFKISDPLETLGLTNSDENGNFPLPAGPQHTLTFVLRLLQPDYGTAEAQLTLMGGNTATFPLVKKGSEGEKAALQGVVLDPDDKPVAGVEVRILSVQDGTSGLTRLGVFWRFVDNVACVCTDKAGRFRIFPIQRSAGPSEIPAKALVYNISVVEPSYALFPHIGAYKSSEEAVIHLGRATLAHHFVFMALDGQPIAADELSKTTSGVSYCVKDCGATMLPERYSSERVKLAPGRYEASYRDVQGVRQINYQPIEVTSDSPEELVFRFPPPVKYAGRVLDGATGLPMAGVFVLAGNPHFAVSPPSQPVADWPSLHALPEAPDLKDPAVALLEKWHPVDALVRTDAQGKYVLTQPYWLQFQALYFLDEARLPVCVMLQDLKPDAAGRVAAPDACLFPTATLLVKPVFDDPAGPNAVLPVKCEWQIEKDGQPEWFARFPQGTAGIALYVEHSVPLKLNVAQPVCVPAGLRLRLQFHCDDQWIPRKYPEVFLLKPGESRRIDDVTFSPTLKVLVKVVDARGTPLQKIPVRCIEDGGGAWSFPHYTDAAGLVRFPLPPGSSGRFGMVELSGKTPDEKLPANLTVAFRVPADKAPAESFVIALTDEQIEQLSKPPPGKR